MEERLAVAESDLSLFKQVAETALDSLQHESARVASMEVALADTQRSLAHARAVFDESKLLKSHFRSSDAFRVLVRDHQQAGVDFMRVAVPL